MWAWISGDKSVRSQSQYFHYWLNWIYPPCIWLHYTYRILSSHNHVRCMVSLQKAFSVSGLRSGRVSSKQEIRDISLITSDCNLNGINCSVKPIDHVFNITIHNYRIAFSLINSWYLYLGKYILWKFILTNKTCLSKLIVYFIKIFSSYFSRFPASTVLPILLLKCIETIFFLTIRSRHTDKYYLFTQTAFIFYCESHKAWMKHSGKDMQINKEPYQTYALLKRLVDDFT